MTEAAAGRQVSSAAFWSYAGALAERGLRFAVFVIIARFVVPEQFGIVVLAVLILTLLQDLSQLGMGEALVRQPHIEPITYDSAFWGLLGVSLLMTLLYLAGLWLFVDQERQTLLWQVLLAVSPGLLISALGSVHQARLLRELGFRELTMRTIGASLMSGIIAIILATMGWGIWALAAKSLLQAIFQTMLLWYFCPWRPRFAFSMASLRPVIPDSVRLLGSSALNQLNQKGFDLAAGLLLGAAALAILRVAGQTVLLLIELTVGPMTMAAFAILARYPSNAEVGRKTFALLSQSTALLVYPAFFGLAAISDILLPFVFGEQWAQAAQFLRLLALLAVPIHLQMLLTAAYFAAGRTDRILHWQMAMSAATLLGIAFGVPFGLWGLAIATVVHLYLLIPLGLWWLKRDTYFHIHELFRAIVPSMACAALMALAVCAVRPLLAERLDTPFLLVALIALGVVLFGSAALFIAPELLRSGWHAAKQKLRIT